MANFRRVIQLEIVMKQILQSSENFDDSQLLFPLAVLLQELVELVNGLDDSQYVQRPVGNVSSSIGSHLRHSLDHVKHLIDCLETGELDYDARERGTAVESDRAAAIEQIQQLKTRMRGVDALVIDRPIRLRTLLSSDGPALVMTSSFGREVAYVVSHTIHHNALIAAMVKTLDGRLPEQFGYAPSTLRYAASLASAEVV